MQLQYLLFDRRVKKLHRKRAAKLLNADNNHLLKEVVERLIERLTYDITPAFANALLIDCTMPTLVNYLSERQGTKHIACTKEEENANGEYLPFEPESFDLVLSFMGLHWINDVPGYMAQIQKILKKDGLFLASFPGGKTLHELRHAALEAESALKGGASPRVSPMVDVRDAGALLQRARFSLPVSDSEIITMLYKDAFALMRDLRAMGESNALLKREKTFTSRRILSAIAEKYRELYANAEDFLPATFEIVTLTGWKG